MKYQETGRFGRITKHLRNQGFELEMHDILFGSDNFSRLNKIEQTNYIETVMQRIIENIGEENAKRVLFECGAQCCGKSWSKFVKRIWDNSKSYKDFFEKLNCEEEKYNTQITYNSVDNSIIVERSKCICGLINKGDQFKSTKIYCMCSIGHMSAFFNTVFSVKVIQLEKSIYAGEDLCRWIIKLDN